MKSIDVILPCYNPEPGWAENIIDAYRSFRASFPEVKHHLILVNDGAKKGISSEEVDKLSTEIPSFHYETYPENHGKGYALRKGIAKSQADLSIFTDVDFPYEAKSLNGLCKKLMEGADVVVGVRDESYYENVPKGRVRISKVFKYFIRKFFKLPVSDTQCGLKGFNASGREVFLRTTMNRYLFDLEFVFLASRVKDLKLIGYPVTLKPSVVFSKMNTKILFQEGINFMKIFIKGLFRRQ